MIKLLLKRLGQGVLVIFVLQTITFFLVRLLPGNPFLGERKLPEHIMAQLNALYGLDQSALVQYWNYWKGILTAGDFGPSLVREGVQVADIIGQAFPLRIHLRTDFQGQGSEALVRCIASLRLGSLFPAAIAWLWQVYRHRQTRSKEEDYAASH